MKVFTFHRQVLIYSNGNYFPAQFVIAYKMNNILKFMKIKGG